MASEKTPQRLDYYDYGPVLSYGAAYNFIVGARGLGKTYGAKLFAINDYIKNGSEFVYLRRYKSEGKNRQTFFSDIEHEFPEHQFRVNGSEFQIARVEDGDKPDWVTFGYFLFLSVAGSIKSVAFPNVKTIIYDEFIIEKGSLQYLPREAEAFNDFYSTVDRWKDKTRVFFLANGLSIMNPYFLEYDIQPGEREFARSHGGFIVSHFPESEKFASQVKQTRFGQFINTALPDYADYSIDNKFKDKGGQLLGDKTSAATYHCTLITRTGTFSVWLDLPMIYVQEKRPKNELILTNELNLVTDGVNYAEYSSKTLQYLRTYFKTGRVRYDSDKTRNAFMNVYRR